MKSGRSALLILLALGVLLVPQTGYKVATVAADARTGCALQVPLLALGAAEPRRSAAVRTMPSDTTDEWL
jgi:hypothetical protein